MPKHSNGYADDNLMTDDIIAGEEHVVIDDLLVHPWPKHAGLLSTMFM